MSKDADSVVHVRCLDAACGWYGPPEECLATMSVYSDLRCPKCGTTNLDTSEINRAWAAEGKCYGYGDNNSLDTSEGDRNAPDG